jgi:hypothetical protein
VFCVKYNITITFFIFKLRLFREIYLVAYNSLTMFDNKVTEVAKKFICNKCNYKCIKKSDYNKHLLTAKHKMFDNAVKNVAKVTKACICDCGKEYKHNQSYYRHKKMCSFVVSTESQSQSQSMIDIISQNKELMNLLIIQNQEHREETSKHREETSKLQNTILEMAPKIGNNNNTTNNNQFNLQVFLNEDCKEALNFSEFIEKIQISFDDLENQAENGYVKGISKLFIENLQKLGINKRPIHCTDKKRKTLYIKENDEWDKEGSLDSLKNGIQEVTRRTYCELMKSKAENEEEYRDADSEFSCKCLTIQQNLTPTYPRETSIGKVIEKITQNTGIIEK